MSKKNPFEDEPKWIETLKNDPDWEIRRWQARRLGEWGSEAAVQPLCDALFDDKSEKVQFEAIKAISKIYPRLNDKEPEGKIIHALIAAELKPNTSEIARKVVAEMKYVKRVGDHRDFTKPDKERLKKVNGFFFPLDSLILKRYRIGNVLIQILEKI